MRAGHVACQFEHPGSPASLSFAAQKEEYGPAEAIRVKADTYVLEANVHFPTDVNLLWDAQRKCADLLVPLAGAAQLAGWRKCRDWRRRLKGQMIGLTRLSRGGGPNPVWERRGAAIPKSTKPGGVAVQIP